MVPGDQCLCDAEAGLPSCQLEIVWEVTHLPHSLGSEPSPVGLTRERFPPCLLGLNLALWGSSIFSSLGCLPSNTGLAKKFIWVFPQDVME